MSDIAPAGPIRSDAWLEPLLRNARLASGVVLMTFVALHLANHALNLISLEAAEGGRLAFLALWRNPVGTVLLYGSLAAHLTLTLLALYRRRTLVMPVREWAQLLLGLAIPLLIAQHVVGTRLMHELFGLDDTYHYVAWSLWSGPPVSGLRQAVAVVVIWAHGCLGLYFWLRYRAWYSRAAPWLLVAAVLIPVLALLGFAEAGRSAAAIGPPRAIDPALAVEAVAVRDRIGRGIHAGFAVVVAGVLAARLLRNRIERRRLIEIRYPANRTVRVPRGYSVLDASRLGGIPHYAVCGGRGRCSTCRIRVLEGLGEQPEPGPVEAATLARIGAGDDVRLACQLKPQAPLMVAPLLMPSLTEPGPALTAGSEPGREQVLAVMFCDMRGFTALSDRRLPYDVVFLLNRYFAVIGEAVEKADGRLDKFIGDGALAIFGLDATPGDACRQVVAAARTIIEDVRRLSEELSDEIGGGQIRLAIGIHVGQAIVGTMGHGAAMGLTAIGDTVNIGSRLEALAKERDAEMVISEAAVRLSGLDFSAFDLSEIEIRGRVRPLRVRILPHGATLPA